MGAKGRCRGVFHGLARGLEKVEEALVGVAAALMVLMLGIIVRDVLGRWFWGRPAAWSVEVSEWILVYVTFLTGAWILREHGHVSMDVLARHLPPARRAALATAHRLLSALVCLVMAWQGVVAILDVHGRGVLATNVLQVPMWMLLLPIPLGCLTLGLRLIHQVWARRGQA